MRGLQSLSMFVAGMVLPIAVAAIVVASNFNGSISAAANTVAGIPAEEATPEEYNQPQGMPDINTIFDKINAERTSRGLKPVERDATLTAVAQQRAKDMADNHYYAHESPSGKYFYDIFKEYDYTVRYGCENLDLQFEIAADIYVQDWLNSKSHRECMLTESITRVGSAVTTITSPGQTKKDAKPMYVVVTIYSQPN